MRGWGGYLRVECESTERDDQGEGEVVEVWVVLLREHGVLLVLCAHVGEVELFACAAGNNIDVLLEHAG